MPTVLRADKLTRVIDGKTLVDAVSVEVQPGEVVALIGPSGAGKSSFLRLINRLDEPTGGTAYLNSEDYRRIPPRELRRRVGMVMQAAHLFPGTVADNLQFGPSQRGEHLSDDTMERLLARVDLSGYATRPIDHLSGGEGQRVSIARTLANSPDVLLLDEPTSALDDEAEQHVESLVCDIVRERQLACLWITHDMPQAARVAQRVMLLEGGRLVRIGTPEEMLHVKPVL
jgi:putative ABC transport system ATP-binding protein